MLNLPEGGAMLFLTDVDHVSFEKAGMSTGFVFPTRAFLLFVTVMLLLEVLMTILLIHSWKKQSVIEIMRN